MPALVYYWLVILPLMAAAPHLVGAVWSFLGGGFGRVEAVQLLLSLALVSVSLAAGLVLEPAGGVDVRDSLVLVASAWALVPLLSAVVVSVAVGVPLVDSWFESVSGYTTTGLSVFTGQVDPAYGVYVPRVEELPLGVLYWRAAAQWIGGFGIVVAFYAFARLSGLPARLVGFAEGRFERLEPSIAKSLRALMRLYLLLTLLSTLLLLAAGMSPGDALYHAMTALSTGGFSSHSSSIAWFHSPAVEAAVIVSMLLGAMNFADLHKALRRLTSLGAGSKARMSGEAGVMLTLLVLALPVAAALLQGMGLPVARALREAAFDVSSALSTTGFSVSDLGRTSDAYKYLLTILMFIGGSAFSTAGGIKLYRLAVLASSIRWSWARVLHGPDYLQVYRVGATRLDAEELARVAEVVFLFALLDAAGTLALLVTVPGTRLADAAFEATSALCTVGLSTGITGAAAPTAAKLVLITLMSLGRLEIHLYIAALAALAYKARERRHRHPPGHYHLPETSETV